MCVFCVCVCVCVCVPYRRPNGWAVGIKLGTWIHFDPCSIYFSLESHVQGQGENALSMRIETLYAPIHSFRRTGITPI